MTVTDSAPVDHAHHQHSDERAERPTREPVSLSDPISKDRAARTKREAFGFGFGIASALIGLTVLLVPLGTSNDDVLLNSIFTGQFIGEAGPQGLFTHVLVGFIIKSLSATWPATPWFAVLLLGTHLAASGSFLTVVALRAGRRSIAALAGVLSIIGLDLWAVSELSWTSAAFASTAAGLAVAVSRSIDHLSGRAIVIWATVLIGWGAALRFDSFIGAVLVATPVIAAAIIDGERRRIAMAAVSCGMLAAAIGFVGQQQSMGDDWQAFADYTAVRGPLADSSRLASVDFDDPTLVELEITATEVLLFDSWFFDDPAVFGLDNLVALTEATARGVPSVEVPAPESPSEPPPAGDDQSSLLGNLTEHGLKLILIAALALLVIGSRVRPVRKLGALATLGGATVLIPAIMILARMTGRVLVGLLLTAAYLAIASTAEVRPVRSRATSASMFVLAGSAAVSAVVLVAAIGPANQRQHDAEVDRLTALSSLDEDGIFLLWEEPLGDLGLLGLNDLPDLDLVLNGWLISSPAQEAQLERLGINDQFSALAERDDIYPVSADPQRLAALADYLERRRDLTVDVTPGSGGVVADVVRRETVQ